MPKDSHRRRLGHAPFARSSLFLLLVATLSWAGCASRSDSGLLAAAGSQITVEPASIPADGSSRASVDIWIRDGDGNPQRDITVTLASAAAVTLVQPVLATDANGHTAGAAYGNVPGDVVLAVQAKVKGKVVTTPATAHLTLVPAANSIGNQLQLIATPGTASLDDTVEHALIAKLTAKNGAPIAGVPINITSSRARDVVSTLANVTDAHGTLTGSVSSTLAGLATLSAAVATGPSASTTTTFVAGTPNAAHTYFISQAGNALAADGVTPNAVEVFVGDQFGNPVVGVPVSVSSMGNSIIINPPSGIADASGVFHATVTTTTLGPTTLSVSTGSVALAPNLTLAVGPASASASSLVLNTNSLVADGATGALATLVLRDAAGHARSGDAVQWADSSAQVVVTPLSTTTDAAGMAQATLRTTLAGNTTVSVQSANVTLFAPLTFVAGPPAAAASQWTATPNAAVADLSASIALQLLARDAYGNATPGVGVSFAATGTGNQLQSTTATTDATGAAGTTLRSSVAESKDVTAGFGGVSKSTTVLFVPGPVSPNSSAFSACPNHLIADGNSQGILSLTARDMEGNPLVGQTVLFASSGGNADVLGSPAATTDASGLATSTLRSTLAGTRTLTATLGNMTLTRSLTLYAGPPSTLASQLGITPNHLVADGTSSATVAVFAADAYGNPVANQSVALTASGNGVIWQQPNGQTDATGHFATSVQATLAETKLITATLGQTSLSGSIEFVAGAPNAALSSFVTAPSHATANDSNTVTLTLSLRDAYGNPTPQVAYTLSSASSNDTILPPSGTTDAGGQASAQLRSTRAEGKVLSATAGNITLTATASFDAGAPVLGGTTFVVSPATTSPDSATPVQLQLRLADAEGNPVPGQSAALTSSVAGDALAPNTLTSDANGYATATILAPQAGNHILSATLSNYAVATTLSVLPGAPNQQLSSFNITPGQIIADGTSTATIAVTLRDRAGNPVPGQSVAVSSDSAAVMLSPTSAPTDATGAVSFAATSTVAAQSNLTVTSGSVTYTAVLTFVPGPVSNTTSTLSLTPNVRVADGSSTIAIAVYLADAHNNPIGSQALTLSATSTNNVFVQPGGNTAADGTFSSVWSTTKAAPRTLTVNVGTTTLSASAAFVAGAPTAVTSTLGASPSGVVADSQSTSTLAIYLADAYGNPVGNQLVTWTTSGTQVTFSAPTSTTDATGHAGVTVRSSLAQQLNIIATAGGAQLTTPVSFVAGSPNAATSSLVLSPNVSAAGANITTSILLADAFGNPIPSQGVALAGGTGIYAANQMVTTNAAGQASLVVQPTLAQNATITASVGNFVLSQAQRITPAAISLAQSSLTLTPNTGIVANGTATTQINGRFADVYGNPWQGQSVALNAQLTRYIGQRYAAQDGYASGSNLIVNGVNQPNYITFPATYSWNNWRYAPDFPVTLINGTNQLEFLNGGHATTIDLVTIATQESTQAIEAESGTLGGSAATATGYSGYSGSGYVYLPSTGAGSVAIPFSTVAGSGNVYVQLRYIAQASFVQPDLALNGTGYGRPTLVQTGNTWTWSPIFALQVAPGSNVVSLTADGADVWIDQIVIVRRSAATTIQAETGTLGGGAIVSTQYPGYSGTGFVGNLNSVTNTLTLSAPVGSETFAPSTFTTDATGAFGGTWASTAAEIKTLAASLGGATLTASATFTPGTPSVATSPAATLSANALVAGTATTLGVQLLDASGNPVPNQSVTFAGGASGVQGAGNVSLTDAFGTASMTLVPTSTLVQQLCVQASAFAQCVNVAISPANANATVSFLAASPTPLMAGANIVLQAGLRDVYNNPIAGTSVNFSASNATSLNISVPATDANGNAYATALYTAPSSTTLQVTMGSVTKSQTLSVHGGAAYNLNVVYDTRPWPAGTPLTVNLAVYDRYGNISDLYAGTVSFSSTASSTLLPANYTFGPADAGVHQFTGGLRIFSIAQPSDNATVTVSGSGISNQATVSLPANANMPIGIAYTAKANSYSPPLCLGMTNADPTAGNGLSLAYCQYVLPQTLQLYSDSSLRLANMCLRVPAGNYVAGQVLDVQQCTHDASMRWSLTSNSIVSQGNPSLCVDPTGASAALVGCGSANAQLFSFAQTSSYFKIGTHDGRDNIDVDSSSYVAGIDVRDYPVNAENPMVLNSNFNIMASPSLCMDTTDSTVAAGKNLILQTCANISSQQWLMSGRAIQSLSNPSLCITNNGFPAQFHLDTCTAANHSQNFTLPTMSNTGQLVSLAYPTYSAELCAQTQSASFSPNLPLFFDSCRASSQQVMTFRSVQGSYAQFGLMFPLLYQNSGLGQPIVDIRQSSPSSGATVYASYYSSQASQALFANFHDLGFQVSFSNNAAIRMDPVASSASPTTSLKAFTDVYPNTQQEWAFAPLLPRLAPTGAPSLCLAASSLNGGALQPLTFQSCVTDATQQALIPMLVQSTGPDANSQIRIGGLCVDANGPGANSQVILRECNTSASQMWNVQATANALRNGQSQCIDASNAAVGATVLAQGCSSAAAQNFTMKF